MKYQANVAALPPHASKQGTPRSPSLKGGCGFLPRVQSAAQHLMNWIKSRVGALLPPILPFSFWAVRLTTGRLLTERDLVADPVRSHLTPGELSQFFPHWTPPQREYFLKTGKRCVDWSLDLVTTGDILKIKELWLQCPPPAGHILGPAVLLPITERGTAFQWKVSNLFVGGEQPGQRRLAQGIGRVDNKATGDCTCYIWDVKLGLVTHRTNIYSFRGWADHIAPRIVFDLEVLGLHLS